MKRWLQLFGILFLTLLAAPLFAQCGSISTAINTPDVYTSNSASVLPAVGGSYLGEYGCSAIRVSTGTTNCDTHEYSQMSPFSDQSHYLLCINQTLGGWQVLNWPARTVKCSVFISGVSEPRWAIVGAPPGDGEGIFYYHVNQTIRKYDVNNCTSTLYDDLSTPLPGNNMFFCGGQSDISYDGNHLCVSVGLGPIGETHLYTISTKTLGPALSCNSDPKCSLANANNASVLPISNNIIVDPVNAGFPTMLLFDSSTGLFIKRVWWRSHYEVALDASGDEVLVLFNTSENGACSVACTEIPPSPPGCGFESVLKVRVSDRALTCLIPGGPGNNPAGLDRIDGHLTVNNEGGRHFRMCASNENYNQSDQPPTGLWLPYTNEIICVDLDGTNKRRIIHHLSRRFNGGYWVTPRGALDRCGCRFIYDSNFGEGSTDTEAMSIFVINLDAPVLPAPPVITSVTVAGGTVGVPYSDTLTSTCAASPCTWGISSPIAGLMFSLGGTLSGTPTQSGAFVRTYMVTDAMMQSAMGMFTLNISAMPSSEPVPTSAIGSGVSISNGAQIR